MTNHLIASLGCGAAFLAALLFVRVPGPEGAPPQKRVRVAIVGNVSAGPRAMAEGGLIPLLANLGAEIESLETIALSEAEQSEYGAWNRDALESRHLGALVAKSRAGEGLILGLLSDCTDLLGMLAGLQHLRPAEEPATARRPGLAGLKPLRVGLLYFDAHADFNTPETTLSGMLGGMDVAVASGMCLTRLRQKAGLDPALPTRYIVFGGLRDVDPLEQELLDRSEGEFLSVEDIRSGSDEVDRQMKRLSGLTDVIYAHVDMDVLNPSEVSGHPLSVPAGPTSRELAAVLRKVFSYPKAGALGIASLPSGERDKGGESLRAAYRLVEGAILGLRER